MVAQHSKVTAHPQIKELSEKARAIADLNYSWFMALGHRQLARRILTARRWNSWLLALQLLMVAKL